MSASSRRRLAAAMVVVALSAAACGTRVDDDIRRRAALAALGEGGGLSGASDLGTAAQGKQGTDLGTTPGGASGPAGPGGGGSAGVAAPPGGNGGATDVAVTANSILLGNVSDLSGPVPGLFEGTVNGTLAYLTYVNSQGGIYGRQLRLKVGDGQTDCGQNQSQHQSLLPQVFAFVGSFSVYDDCGARVLKQHPEMPEVSYALSQKALGLKNFFSPSPLPSGYPTGPFAYWKGKFGSKVTKVGSLAPNVPAAQQSWIGIRAAAESVGWKFPYVRYYSPTEQDFTADVQKMKRDQIQIIYLVAAEVTQVAQVKQAADEQDYHPIFIAPVAYAEDFVDRVGGPDAAEGILGANLYAMFFGAADAKNIPAVALFQQWMKRVRPNSPINLFAMYGWSSAQLFVQALKAAGPRATRAGLLAQLRKIHSYDADGILPQRDPAGHEASQCYVLWHYTKGDFRRVDTPSAGYRCDGTYYHKKS